MATTTAARTVQIKPTYESWAWKWMRYSGVLLIPLAWLHVLIKDALIGVHAIDLNYVQQVWAMTSWRVFDFALLAFAFAHGMNGLRQVINDFVESKSTMRVISWVLFIVWLVISIIGAIAIIGGVRMPEA